MGKKVITGRPLRRRKARMNIPAGIEKTLYKAAIDADFRRMLLEDRPRAVEEHGPRLTDMEAHVLANVPDERLELMIDQIRPARHGKRKFMKAVATAVVTLATGTAGVACEESGTSTDSRADDIPTDTPIFDVTGDMADIPDIPLELDTGPDPEGDMADIPDEVVDGVIDVEDGADAEEEDVEEEDMAGED